MRSNLAVVCLLALVASSARIEGQVRTITLSKAVAEHPEPLSQPGTLLELADGRVLVSDVKERLLYAFDFGAESAAQVSRQGGGPLEYRFPAGIFASGDSVIVVDMMQQRLLILDRRAVPQHTQQLITTGDLASAFTKIGAIIAIDARGRVYSEARGITLVPGKMPVVSDTVALVRWSVVGTRGDTLAIRLEHTESPRLSGNPSSGLNIKLRLTLFQPRDAWAVFPDGRVGVARAAGYRTEWIDVAGGKRMGASVPYTPLPITEKDKERARKVTREAALEGLKLGSSMAAGSGQKMPNISIDVEDPESWPKVKPPFSAVRAAPDGRLWVVRSGDDEDGMEYDVLSPAGAVELHVRTPKRVTLLGFGKGVLYAVRRDEDDLRYLQRYRFP